MIDGSPLTLEGLPVQKGTLAGTSTRHKARRVLQVPQMSLFVPHSPFLLPVSFFVPGPILESSETMLQNHSVTHMAYRLHLHSELPSWKVRPHASGNLVCNKNGLLRHLCQVPMHAQDRNEEHNSPDPAEVSVSTSALFQRPHCVAVYETLQPVRISRSPTPTVVCSQANVRPAAYLKRYKWYTASEERPAFHTPFHRTLMHVTLS